MSRNLNGDYEGKRTYSSNGAQYGSEEDIEAELRARNDNGKNWSTADYDDLPAHLQAECEEPEPDSPFWTSGE